MMAYHIIAAASFKTKSMVTKKEQYPRACKRDTHPYPLLEQQKQMHQWTNFD